MGKKLAVLQMSDPQFTAAGATVALRVCFLQTDASGAVQMTTHVVRGTRPVEHVIYEGNLFFAGATSETLETQINAFARAEGRRADETPRKPASGAVPPVGVYLDPTAASRTVIPGTSGS